LTQIGPIEPELRLLLSSRRELLDKILAANQAYFSQLSEIELLLHNLITTVEAFHAYLAERLLWIRSMPLMHLSDFRSLWQEITLLVAPDQWRAVGAGLVRQSLASPLFILGTFLGLFLMGWGRKIREYRALLLQQARNPITYRFAQPLTILVLTALVALPVPLLVFICGWELNRMADQSDLSRAVAGALLVFAYRYLVMRWFRSLLAPNGLAEGVFNWSKTTTRFLYQEIGIFIALFLPAVFVVMVAFFAVQLAGGNHLLGRLALILVLVITLVSCYRILHPKTALSRQILNIKTHPLYTRLYPLLFAAVLLIPVVLIGLVIAGYVFAVGALIRCIVNSIWLISGMVLCHQLIEQWLVQTSRQLARQKALRQRAQAQVNTNAQKESGELNSGVIDDIEEDPVELTVESRKLIDTIVAIGALVGLWLVWREVLPALNIFKEFTLWSYTVNQNGQSTVVPVTLADAGLTVLISIITLTATLHLPAVLKIALFQHLRMGPGGQYTAIALTRYSIGGIGVLVIADILGFSWSQIQWLVAALGVGIGFGLQEIVANFISGLIILFERPIRVGDVVTVGSTDGVVTRIRIRATTIKDFDGKELLVPNKEFISGHLLNWSLSDPVIRILVPVGVAYGSDVQTAMRLMLQAAQENPLILEMPSPIVTFDSFGDNSLLLTLRSFVGSVDERVAAKSALHLSIDQMFREAEITMAFPQRDVHLDATKPLEIRVVGDQRDAPQAVVGKVA
jgi:potassium efflux system protein